MLILADLGHDPKHWPSEAATAADKAFLVSRHRWLATTLMRICHVWRVRCSMFAQDAQMKTPLIRDSRVIRQGSSGPIGPYRVPTGFRGNPVLARQGSTDRSTVLYRCTIHVRTPWARHGAPTGPPGPRRDPTDPRRTAGGPQLLPGLGGPQLLLASASVLVRDAR